MENVVAQNVSTAPVTPKASSRIFSALSTKHSALLFLILIGGLLRFSFLDKPPIWYDEAATFARTCGTYEQMLDSLQEAGFGPLHYTAYWWIRHGMPMWGKFETVKVNAFSLGNGFGRMRPGARNGKVEARDLVPTHPIIKSGQVLMTPFMLRLIPAICGTLMIPAMFWLAIELTRRRDVAIFAAALTTFSAYLLNYSRDAKMYMELWLFVALNVAALLWWLRTRTVASWLCWIVTGTIMIGLHLLGVIAIGIELLFVLVAPRALWKSNAAVAITPLTPIGIIFEYFGRQIWRAIRDRKFSMRMHLNWTGKIFVTTWQGFRFPPLVAFLLGCVLIGIGPYGYFKKFNQYTQRVSEVGWQGTGVQWIPIYNTGRSGPDLVRYATSAFFVSWEWPKVNPKLKINQESEISPRVNYWLKTGCFGLLGFALLALLPWRKLWELLLKVFRKPLPVLNEPIPWRTLVCVIVWIVLPTYVIYLLSIPPKNTRGVLEFEHSSPTFWLTVFCDFWKSHRWFQKALPVSALFAFFFSGRSWKERAMHSLYFMIGLVATWSILRTTYWIFDSQTVDNWMVNVMGKYGWKSHGSVWIPRYLGVIIPALFVMAAALIARLPKFVRLLPLLLFIAINLGQYTGRVFAGSEPPVDTMVKDSIAWRENEKHDGAMKMYYAVQRPPMMGGLGPGTGVLGLPTSKYYWTISTRSPSDPDEIRGFDFGDGSEFPPLQSSYTMIKAIKSEAAINSKLTTLVVWDSIRVGKTEVTDAVQDALGSNWSRISDETFFDREHWTWRNLETIRRRVYVKNTNAIPTPASKPATTPATTQSNSR